MSEQFLCQLHVNTNCSEVRSNLQKLSVTDGSFWRSEMPLETDFGP